MSVMIKAEETAQNYDMQIDVQTMTDVSEEMTGVDSCTTSRVEYRCHSVCRQVPAYVAVVEDNRGRGDNRRGNGRGHNGGNNRRGNHDTHRDHRRPAPRPIPVPTRTVCRPVCGNEVVYYPGVRDISFKVATSTKFIDLMLISPETNMSVGTFNANKVVSEKKVDIEYLSSCR